MSAEDAPARTSVAIVGAGPVGLVTALALARRGIAVTVFEREADVFRSPRAMTYHWSCLFGLDDLGLLDDMARVGFYVKETNFHILATGENVTFSLEPLRGLVAHPYNLTLGQDRLAEVVIEHLRAYPHAAVRWSAEVTQIVQDATGVDVRYSAGGETHALRCDWIIAADGGTSPTRKMLGLRFEGLTWPHNFVATNVRFDFHSTGLFETNYVVDPHHGAVVAKVRQDGLWRVTWSEDVDADPSSIDERVAAQYAAVMPAGASFELTAKSMYRMHQRAADTMRLGRVLLAGDAAHVTNPTSGFGLVGGLYDAYVLSDALGAVIRGEARDAILDHYSDDRLTAFWTVSSPVSTESKRLVFHSHDADRLEVDMNMYRRIAADPAMLVNFWSQGKRIETPSLVTGRYLSAGRNDATR
ncbi:MAG: monooxygenase, FAD-binding [Candidatus Eremiobacteraeota bacterium]|nr:monooxygenase, FAD-binding [Candidatus Eremiobacteraeota bacterium]